MDGPEEAGLVSWVFLHLSAHSIYVATSSPLHLGPLLDIIKDIVIVNHNNVFFLILSLSFIVICGEKKNVWKN